MASLMIPIRRAFICCQCELVLDTAQVCPHCDSGQAIASLSAWLSQRAIADVKLALDMASAVRAK